MSSREEDLENYPSSHPSPMALYRLSTNATLAQLKNTTTIKETDLKLI